MRFRPNIVQDIRINSSFQHQPMDSEIWDLTKSMYSFLGKIYFSILLSILSIRTALVHGIHILLKRSVSHSS